MRAQLLDIKRAKAAIKNKKIQFLLGVGTFVNEEQLHSFRNLTVENPANALMTLKKLLTSDAELAHSIDGISIYCDWQTEPDEWETIYREWAQFGERK